MSKLDIKNTKGEVTANVTLKKEIFNIEPNDSVLKDAIVLSLASLRQGTHSTKTRSEVSGGGAKPWRQKGTGRARQGSIRATQWRGGGIVFGPQPRSYKKKQNKKERRLALLSALSYKAQNKDITIIDEFDFKESKTKNMISLLQTLNLDNCKVLVVLNNIEENVFLSGRNLPQIKVILVDAINTLDVVTADKLLFTKDALKKIEEVLGNEK
ncbi:MAG: 50S ribosomal protein L4 [bacterium]|nr:50S ribosomal protein L4 [bacterium]